MSPSPLNAKVVGSVIRHILWALILSGGEGLGEAFTEEDSWFLKDD